MCSKIIPGKPTQEELGQFTALHIERCQSSLVEEILYNGKPFAIEDIQNYEEKNEDGEMLPKEIYEWWLVSDWLLEKLRDQKEAVIDNEYGQWWGRTCTGQAIKMDSVIETIYKEMQRA